jgi:transcriptional regulator with XRE-family HTH domain
MTAPLHKNTQEQLNSETNATDKTSAVNRNNSNIQNLPVLDIEKENRLSRVVSLYSKGLTQAEIAQDLDIDQSTVSRDLQFIKQEAKKKIEKYLNEDILFEYLRYIAGSNEVTRELWGIVQSEKTMTKDKMNALSLLMQSYNKRLEMLIGGPESYMNAKKSVSEIKFQEKVDNDPMLKMLSERNRFPSPFSSGSLFDKKTLKL